MWRLINKRGHDIKKSLLLPNMNQHDIGGSIFIHDPLVNDHIVDNDRSNLEGNNKRVSPNQNENLSIWYYMGQYLLRNTIRPYAK